MERPLLGFCSIENTAGNKINLYREWPTLVFLLKGSILVEGEYIEPFTVEANHLFALPGEMHFRMTLLEDIRVLRLCLMGESSKFCSTLITDEALKQMDYHKSPTVKLPMKPIVCNYVELMMSYLTDQPLSTRFQELKQAELEALLQSYYTQEELTPLIIPIRMTSNEFFGRVLKDARNYPTIDEMAAHHCMSRSTFIRRFASYFKESPNKWITKIRVRDMYHALRETDQPLSDVATKLRFASQQSMSSFCRQHFHATPLQVRSGMADEYYKQAMQQDIAEPMQQNLEEKPLF